MTSLTIDELKQLFRDVISENKSTPNTLTNDERLMTLAEAATYLRLSTATIRSKMKGGQIPYKKLGRKPLFEKSKLAALGDVKFKRSVLN